MAANVRASVRRALKQLQTQRSRIDREISALEAALAALQGVSGRAPAKKASEKKSQRARRKMSAKARKAASKRMKAFWANKKAQTEKWSALFGPHATVLDALEGLPIDQPMSLNVGTTLGPYSVTAKIGEGGMGEVYRATDTQLGRDVALKVLPDVFAADADRLARFQRKAQVLASLNHPNIAAIHGLEQADGVRALVLELVEGPTLADRIAKGPIPLDEALPIAKQIEAQVAGTMELREINPGPQLG